MNYADIEEIMMAYNDTSISFPFDEETAVFKVAKKMFALTNPNKKPLSINLKCDPDDAQILRSQFKAITPGYHMNKEHWNTIILDGSLSQNLIKKLLNDSYNLVVLTMSKKEQKRLGVF